MGQVLCLLLAWVITFLFILRGVKSTGKVGPTSVCLFVPGVGTRQCFSPGTQGKCLTDKWLMSVLESIWYLDICNFELWSETKLQLTPSQPTQTPESPVQSSPRPPPTYCMLLVLAHNVRTYWMSYFVIVLNCGAWYPSYLCCTQGIGSPSDCKCFVLGSMNILTVPIYSFTIWWQMYLL